MSRAVFCMWHGSLGAPTIRVIARGKIGWGIGMETTFPERRLLIGNGKLNYLIFKFSQSKADGSIYISSPRFEDTKWISLTREAGQVNVQVTNAGYDGHVSVHGSGIASVRNNRDPRDRKLIIAGNYLFDLPRSQAGVRHLCTVQLGEPSHIPISARKSDYIISSSQPLSPIGIIFFAVPRNSGIRTVDIQSQFHLDDQEHFPPPEAGLGLIELVHHSVAWFSYRTKYMAAWPTAPHVCFFDGFHVPAFMGFKDGAYQFRLIAPTYQMNGDELHIGMNFVDAAKEAG